MATNADFIRLGAKLFLEQCPLYPRLGRELEDTDLPQKPLLRRNHPGDKGKTALDSVPGLSRVRYGEISNAEGTSITNAKQKTGDPLGLRQNSALHVMNINPHDPEQIRIALFYLPYQDDHNFRITLKLKPNESEGRPVTFFITEPVDGCSVYIEGTRQVPTAYHINAVGTHGAGGERENGKFENDSRVWHARWGHMDQRFKTEGTKTWTVQRGVGLVRATKVENDDYMIRDSSVMAVFTEAARRSMPKKIDGQKASELRMFTQGTVFGCLEPDGWHFYVQRRLHVVYTKESGAPIAGMWVPLAVKEFWPTVETGRAV
jgi:hypothetical protein